MPKRILFVTKDKGTFNVTHKIVPVLRERGHEVSVIAEGLSTALWEETGEKLAFKGTVDFTKEPFALDAANALLDIKPDVLVTTGSVPINLERAFAQAAEDHMIPVVVIEDTVGSASRLGMTPDLVLTLNQLAVDFYEKCGTTLNGKLAGVPFKPVGSDYFKRLELSAEKKAEVVKLRQEYRPLVLYSGQGRPFTREILTLAIESIKLTPKKRAGLIVRHHPKKLPDDCLAGINEDLAALERDLPGTLIECSLTSDEAAAVCDVTFTCYGSALNFSAVHGRLAVSAMTPGCVQDLREQTGFDITPLAAVDAARAMAWPMTFDSLLEQHVLSDRQELYAQPFPFDARLAADEIDKVH